MYRTNNTFPFLRQQQNTVDANPGLRSLTRLPCHTVRTFTLRELQYFSFRGEDDGRRIIDKMLFETLETLFRTKWSFAPTELLKVGNETFNQRLLVARVEFIEQMPLNLMHARSRREVASLFNSFIERVDGLNKDHRLLIAKLGNSTPLNEETYGPCTHRGAIIISRDLWKKLNSFEDCATYKSILSNAQADLSYHSISDPQERNDALVKAHAIARERMNNPQHYLYVAETPIDRIRNEFFSTFMHRKESGPHIELNWYGSDLSVLTQISERLNSAIKKIDPSWQDTSLEIKKIAQMKDFFIEEMSAPITEKNSTSLYEQNHQSSLVPPQNLSASPCTLIFDPDRMTDQEWNPARVDMEQFLQQMKI